LDSNTKVREFETTTQEVLPDEDDSYQIVVTTRIQGVTTTTRVPRKLPDDERARPLHDELKKAKEHSLNSPLKIISVTSDNGESLSREVVELPPMVELPAHARQGAVASSSATHARDNSASCYKESKPPQLSSLGTLSPAKPSGYFSRRWRIAAAEEAGLDSAGVLSQEKVNKVDSQRNHSENCCTLPQTQGLKTLLVLLSGEPAAPDIRTPSKKDEKRRKKLEARLAVQSATWKNEFDFLALNDTPSKKDKKRRKKLEARLAVQSATWKNEFDFLALNDIQGYHCQYCVLANANSHPSDQLSTGYKLNADTKLPNPIPSKQIIEQHSQDERHKQNQSKRVDQLRQEADAASPPPPLLSPYSSHKSPATMQHLALGGGGEGMHTFDDSSYRETQHEVLAMSDAAACGQQERHGDDYNTFRNKLHNTEWCQKYRDTNLIQSHGVTDMSQMTTPRLSVTIDVAAPKIYAVDNSTVAAAKDGSSTSTTTTSSSSSSSNGHSSSSSGAGQRLAGISAPSLMPHALVA
jgi:hypothetical protein